MAAKIDQSELDQVIEDYCLVHEATKKTGKIILKTGEEIAVSLKDGQVVCSDKSIKENLTSRVMELRTPAQAMVAANGRKLSSRVPIQEGSALGIMKQCAQGLEPTYQVGKVTAPTAKTVLTAAADASISFEIRQYTHRPDYIEANVRAHLGDKYNDAVVSVFKQDFINSRAWEMVGKQAKVNNSIIDLDNPFQENGMPNIRKDAIVSVKIGAGKQSIESGFQKVNAALWLYQELMQAWIFQGRQCVTKAKSKAAGELLLAANPNQEVQEPGELADEMKERETVENMKGA